VRGFKNQLAGLVLALVVGAGTLAGSDVNEVGAVLVFPVVGLDPTAVSITNAGGRNFVLHFSFINGDSDGDYCYECTFFSPMTPGDTELFVVDSHDGEITFYALDTNVEHTCQGEYGMLIVALEDWTGTVTDNVLLGDSITIDEENGYAYSLPALPFQGTKSVDKDHHYAFNDKEYRKLPRVVATDFIAPGPERDNEAEVTGDLVLFTLAFERQHPPRVDCSVTGFDADEHPFSRSILFGCWELFDLEELSSEFVYGNLGAVACSPGEQLQEQGQDQGKQCDEHGWLSLNCRVDPDGNQVDNLYSIYGGVHGALIQKVTTGGDVVGRSEEVAASKIQLPAEAQAAWARLLIQSVTTGDSVTLHLEGPPGDLLP
jgi:hypothetical protein